MTRTLFIFAIALSISGASASAAQQHALDEINLPEGFTIGIYAHPVPNARAMALSPSGTVFVGSRRAGAVFALIDKNGDGTADRRYVITKGLKMPVGVDFFEGDLYVSAVNRILKYEDIEAHLTDPPPPIVVTDKLPSDVHHGWKFIRFGPDRKLYVPVGAPCNVCTRPDPYATITRMNADGSDFEIYARGVRNSVGFDWHPWTKELWFTDNGRDWLGDDLPPDELNCAHEKGLHFGFPYRHGEAIIDPEFGSQAPRIDFVPPAAELGPHVASLGMRFYTGTMFPEKYRDGIFIAEHGSWNRSTPIGYRVMFLAIEGREAVSYEEFATGWLKGPRVWGRPADVLVMPDGALLVSDDHSGTIYRISYEAPAQ